MEVYGEVLEEVSMRGRDKGDKRAGNGGKSKDVGIVNNFRQRFCLHLVPPWASKILCIHTIIHFLLYLNKK